ncbi:MAG TPA: N-acetylglucosamine-6-phosphate deacetylase [Anaerolineaceae bacterium]|nr:N-acetylglucosamine-6-phosphate deacetylase [Anaerolineaceae bacterium]
MDTLIVHGQVITPGIVISDGSLGISDGKIRAIYSHSSLTVPQGVEVIDADGLYVGPGLIDTHTHGGNGHDFMNCGETGLDEILTWLPSTGVTRVVPTLAASSHEAGLEMIRCLVEAMRRPSRGAKIVGLHLEGPFLSLEKRGDQPAEAVRLPDLAEMQALIAAGEGAVRMVTLAPELPGAIDLVRWLAGEGVRVSAGNSAATYEETCAAIEAGLSRVTHLYNAMPPFDHRRPGLAGAALSRAELCAEIILDGIHVHPAAAHAALRAKGADRLILVTSATQAAGRGDGEYTSPDGQRIFVKDGAARLENGSLAGSILTLDRAVANACAFFNLPPERAIQLASRSPAISLGLSELGALRPGCTADVILFDAGIHVQAAFVAGRRVYPYR